jgi:hypothetical protein
MISLFSRYGYDITSDLGISSFGLDKKKRDL